MANQQALPRRRSSDNPKALPEKPATVSTPDADGDSEYADATESTGGSAADQADAVKEVGDKNAPGAVKRKEAS
ncbi:MAG: hypothetical protein EOP82_30410 [Variovorax sp.]|nr:MAG: hypothetical protein EOP82_30410 [Variovorax sp.]